MKRDMPCDLFHMLCKSSPRGPHPVSIPHVPFLLSRKITFPHMSPWSGVGLLRKIVVHFDSPRLPRHFLRLGPGWRKLRHRILQHDQALRQKRRELGLGRILRRTHTRKHTHANTHTHTHRLLNILVGWWNRMVVLFGQG